MYVVLHKIYTYTFTFYGKYDKIVLVIRMEIWKDIENFEGFYQISNFGRVKSLKKWCGNKHLSKWIDSEKILKPTDNGRGYLIIAFNTNGKKKNYYIHRLVATHFLNKPINKNIVNHKDYNKHNNNVNNLEWCTQKENIKYSINNMKHRKNITHSNTGERYICYRKKTKVYRVIIDKKEYGSFKTLEEAKIIRDKILNEVI